uniref:Uncharacterized protein n=1 Tax=Glossina brevipalpis TaxID=37001 RepID=A0A1A9WIQ4_9MUSC
MGIPVHTLNVVVLMVFTWSSMKLRRRLTAISSSETGLFHHHHHRCFFKVLLRHRKHFYWFTLFILHLISSLPRQFLFWNPFLFYVFYVSDALRLPANYRCRRNSLDIHNL